jgi:hypothetical protein
LLIKKKFFRPDMGIGIYQDRECITAVQADLAPPWHIRWREQQALSEPFDNQALERFFARLHRQAGRQYIPISIALADPWVHQVLLSFESLPGQTRERNTLINWRLERDWQRDAQQHAISWQWLGEQDNQQWVIVQSIEKNRLEPLQQQAREYGLILDSMDTIGNLLLNRISNPADTALLHLQPDYWSFYVTNNRGWPVYRRSKWEVPGEENGAEHFAAQLQRMLVSVGNMTPGRLMLAGNRTALDTNELVEILGRRLELKIESLDMGHADTPGEQLAIQAVGNLCH